MLAKAYYHLPGLFEFLDFYKVFLQVFYQHRDYFYDWCDIGSIYGAPDDTIWGGGRIGCGDNRTEEVVDLMQSYGISSRLTFSNSLLKEEHLSDEACNNLCKAFNACAGVKNGVIVHSDLLLDYLKNTYPNLYYISSTTKVITDFNLFLQEVNREEFSYVVPDFRLNKAFEWLNAMDQDQKAKVEFLLNECCYVGCKDRKSCYENVSKKNLGLTMDDYICKAPDSDKGYSFTKAMKNPAFISLDAIRYDYLPMGFSNFKIEGRGLGSALVFEFLLYYMAKPEYQINIREMVYLDNMLDLF